MTPQYFNWFLILLLILALLFLLYFFFNNPARTEILLRNNNANNVGANNLAGLDPIDCSSLPSLSDSPDDSCRSRKKRRAAVHTTPVLATTSALLTGAKPALGNVVSPFALGVASAVGQQQQVPSHANKSMMGVQGPIGLPGAGGRVDVGLIPYSGIMHGLPQTQSKEMFLGFETSANHRPEPEMVGSFWLNPTQQTLQLGALQVQAVSSHLTVIPGTMLEVQLMVASPGSARFAAIGSPFTLPLANVEDNAPHCFFGPPAKQDLPLAPASSVCLLCSTSNHIRGSLRIGAALAYT